MRDGREEEEEEELASMWKQGDGSTEGRVFRRWDLTGFMNKIIHVGECLSRITTHCLKSCTGKMMLDFWEFSDVNICLPLREGIQLFEYSTDVIMEGLSPTCNDCYFFFFVLMEKSFPLFQTLSLKKL